MGKCLTLNLGRGYRMVHKCMRGNGVVTLQQGGSDSAITSGFGVQTLVPLTNWKPQPDEEVGKIEFCAEHFGLVRNLDENAQHQARDVWAHLREGQKLGGNQTPAWEDMDARERCVHQ